MNYHFIGIGGSGMSPLANIMLDRGERVTGSDMEESGNVRKLKDKGATVFIGHSKENLPQDVDVVVVTPAIPASNPELEKAKKLNKKVIQRSELLGNLMALKKGIAISGTHGKTTTSSLIALVLKRADLDPIAVVGGEIQSLNTSYLSGEGDYFVAEA
ncbi:MAG: UDP-N-acetylmuramate-L-alanine ligase, partial [candidate division CPR2 bacterium GW2011_GWD1_39_7]